MVKSLAQLGFVVGLMILFVLCLMPGGDVPDIGTSDKMLHGLAYVMLGACGRLAFPARRHVWPLFFGLVLLGIGIEFAQTIVPNRDAEFMDGVADAIGTLIGLGIGEMLRRPALRLASGGVAR